MAGNSKRRGATRKPGTKKGPVKGSGGQGAKALRGKGPTPKAEHRTGHPAQRRATAAGTRSGQQEPRRRARHASGEMIAGRNPVAECLRAGAPASALYLALGNEPDERVSQAVQLAAEANLPVLEVARSELDRLTGDAVHQGVALHVPPYTYAHPDDLLAAAADSPGPPLIVALDGVTDPRNLGAVIRSAAAFGAHGVLLPQRRSAGMTAVAWRSSAGTAATLPVAVAPNLTRALRGYAGAGLMIAGLDAGAPGCIDSLDLAGGPLVVVVGSEGRGLSRLVRETCDATVSIPMAAGVESLNASVAAGVLLAEVARRRRQG
jgi:23S rRNA (guanosine2251-2'-O)-methyltransferase